MPYRHDPRPYFDARMAIHIALAAILACLGLQLLLPGDTFSTTPAWRLFARSGTESTWAIAFFVGALAGAIGIDTSHRWLKVASILALATAHGSLALMFLIGNPIGGWSTYAVIAALGYYLAWRQATWRYLA